ncbi:MAG: type III-B CRISPR module-associated protein Cmr3 [Hydrogenibacillus schlegelii]|uniref:Type III-B CRISPR module-associated protein Cmr3 n=1 Tax=Hydrogenibacillus schlegelii TaxID=1484 RepID=A0A947CWI7_HYDSH|nr:type III-B CRISPR module-associated protein Cmr3 [Hydrogenibacillus schlegelii]
MDVWIIEPRDPLIVRDGRPFGAYPGARAYSLDFPYPSTTTGALRTRAGLGPDGRFQERRLEQVKKLCVRGPFLVALDRAGEIDQWFVTPPADALLLDATPETDAVASVEGGASASDWIAVKRLIPLRLPDGVVTDLVDELLPVGLKERDPRKPIGGAPRYWSWDAYVRWLSDPPDEAAPDGAWTWRVRRPELGISGPVQEMRTHVKILPHTLTADVESGALFQTRGLEFTEPGEGRALSRARRLALAVAVDGDPLNLAGGPAPLGGERRLVGWKKSAKSVPAMPADLPEKIAKSGHARLLLLTPAHFRQGWRPSWLLDVRENVRPTLRAIALRRYETVSGWDFARRREKPSRRLAPAGTVLFLRLEGKEADIRRWVQTMWFAAISDEADDRCAGFGVVAVGFWDGAVPVMASAAEEGRR